MRTQGFGYFSDEFFNPICLAAVFLFGLNNGFLKLEYSNWLTGKLSDALYCFVFPLYLSSMLGIVTKIVLINRLLIGAFITVVLLCGMKLCAPFSTAVDALFTHMLGYVAGGVSRNIVDRSDLITLPFVAVSIWFGRLYYEQKR